MTAITNALNGLINKNNDFCCLCFDTISDNPIRLEDEVVLNSNKCETTVALSEILHFILGDKTFSFLTTLESLCKQCTNSAINSYTFIQMSQSNADHLANTLDCLINSISYTTEELESSKTMFVSLNLNDFTSTQFYDNKRPVHNLSSALRRMKSIDKGFKIRKEELLPSKQKHKDDTVQKFAKKSRFVIPILTSDMLLDKNDKTNIKCKECFKQYPTIWNLRNHYIRVHAPKTYKCSECPRSYGSAAFLEAHKTESHCTVVCSECGKTFYNRHTLKMHEMGHSLNLVCQVCGRVYKNKTTYKRHIEINLCGRKTRADPAEAKFTCDYCNKKYTQKMSLRVHIQYEHGNYKAHICEWCGKKFWAQSRLKAHIVKHTKEKNFTCTICSGRFVTKESLLYHTRTHTGERPYPCPHCDSRFLSASRRADHIKRHHTGDIFECDICNSKFNSRTFMRNHRKVHKISEKFNLTCERINTTSNEKKTDGNKVPTRQMSLIKFDTENSNRVDFVSSNSNDKNETNVQNLKQENYNVDGDMQQSEDRKIYLEVSDDADDFIVQISEVEV